MGNSLRSIQSHANPEFRDSMRKFTSTEVAVIKETFKELARRDGKRRTIDKATFLKYFPLPGLMGERLFAMFDRKNNNKIDYEEFMQGISICYKGTIQEKSEFLFQLYDLKGDKSISRDELTQMLYHIPISLTLLISDAPPIDDGEEVEAEEVYLEAIDIGTKDDGYDHHEVVDKIVNFAFEQCDLNKDGKLSLEQFQLWLEHTPEIGKFFESVLPLYGDNPLESNNSMMNAKENNILLSPSPRSRPTSPRGISDKLSFRSAAKSVTPRTSLSPQKANSIMSSSITNTNRGKSSMQILWSLDCDFCNTCFKYCSCCGESMYNTGALSKFQDGVWSFQCSSCTSINNYSFCTICGSGFTKSSYRSHILTSPSSWNTKSGWLTKVGKVLRAAKRRFYILRDRMVYIYQTEYASTPYRVIFLEGCYIESESDHSKEKEDMWKFSISAPETPSVSLVLYASSEADRDEWVQLLITSSQVVPITDAYELGDAIGEGKFSIVRKGFHKSTGEMHAVKVINKYLLEPEAKDLMRTEIAILKLVHHKNIIDLIDVFEDRECIYIVMEFVHGGELFDRITGRLPLSEIEAWKIIRPLADAVSYLHKLGIAHRDLKPENILCGENLGDIKIADFGLSSMVLPSTKMMMACGTLSYVAPEVIEGKGYSMEADLWSIGVIFYILIRGKRPFSGQKSDEIISKIKAGLVSFDSDTGWSSTDEAKELVTGLLHKNPGARFSADDVLKHPWTRKISEIISFREEKKKLESSADQNVETPAVVNETMK